MGQKKTSKYLVKYADDQTLAEKIDMTNTIKTTINGRRVGVKHAVRSEDQLKTTIENNVEKSGMKVNSNKTQPATMRVCGPYIHT